MHGFAQTSYGLFTPLHQAAGNGDMETVRVLLELGPTCMQRPRMDAHRYIWLLVVGSSI
jgi:ankyrin repeat protein